MELSGTVEDPYERPVVSWNWTVQPPENAGYSLGDATSQFTTFIGYGLGDYLVTLVVCVQGDPDLVCTDPASETARLTLTVVNQPPVASLSVEGETTVPVGEQICFNGWGSSDAEGAALIYWWDFGDESENDTSSRVCHTYSSTGVYTVTLQVSDDWDSSNQDQVDITVTQSIPTPQEAIQSLMDEVTTLVSQGELSTDRGDGMITKLSAAITSLNNGLTTDACKQLKAFVNQVTASIKAKKLSSATGQALIASAQDIRALIGCA